MKNISDRVLEALKNSKLVSQENWQKALELHYKDKTKSIPDILVHLGYLTQNDLLSFVSEELKMTFINITRFHLDPDLASVLPEKLARRLQLVPVSRLGDVMTIASSEALDMMAMDEVIQLTRKKILCVLGSENEITKAINELYRKSSSSRTDLSGVPMDFGEKIPLREDLVSKTDQPPVLQSPVVRIVNLLINEAVNAKASDIHIEPLDKKIRVRFRIDGSLKEVAALPKVHFNAILTRIKIMSFLDITENRIPQDGRFKTKLENKEVDFRVSILPVYFGSKLVLRILDKTNTGFGLDNLGLFPETLNCFRRAMAKPYGMILMTGPTGSGKTSTLYSMLNELNSPAKNLITIEDPVEYQLKGVTQIQTKEDIGLTFARGLRAILRQSPDIVMVGEIRDSETADIAIKASLTGQLVLSTLHTNDAASAVTRLIDMNIEPFLIASSVVLVVAQRLCKRTCLLCRQKVEIPKDLVERLRDYLGPFDEDATFYKGVGCPKCHGTGYHGRLAIMETLLIDDTIRDLILKRTSSSVIKEYAIKNGMATLRHDALRKCLQGLTTLEEVIRITAED